MRGTPRLHKILCGELGIIPAYAGNTNSPMIPQEIHGDHPRVCGEHLRKACFRGGLTGSSPRMRGTHVDGIQREPFGGIIPAYAGNTRYNAIDGECRRDHPRVCGEH